MTERIYLIISAIIFTLIALLHFIRLFAHWSVQIGTITVPLWGSWLGFFIGAALSIWALTIISRWRISH